MAQNPLCNLGSDDIIEFLLANGKKGGPIHGDDQIFYDPRNYKLPGIKVTLNKKNGTPRGTVGSIIKSSGISKSAWLDWFSKKRNLKKS